MTTIVAPAATSLRVYATPPQLESFNANNKQLLRYLKPLSVGFTSNLGAIAPTQEVRYSYVTTGKFPITRRKNDPSPIHHNSRIPDYILHRLNVPAICVIEQSGGVCTKPPAHPHHDSDRTVSAYRGVPLTDS